MKGFYSCPWQTLLCEGLTHVQHSPFATHTHTHSQYHVLCNPELGGLGGKGGGLTGQCVLFLRDGSGEVSTEVVI